MIFLTALCPLELLCLNLQLSCVHFSCCYLGIEQLLRLQPAPFSLQLYFVRDLSMLSVSGQKTACSLIIPGSPPAPISLPRLWVPGSAEAVADKVAGSLVNSTPAAFILEGRCCHHSSRDMGSLISHLQQKLSGSGPQQPTNQVAHSAPHLSCMAISCSSSPPPLLTMLHQHGVPTQLSAHEKVIAGPLFSPWRRASLTTSPYAKECYRGPSLVFLGCSVPHQCLAPAG